MGLKLSSNLKWNLSANLSSDTAQVFYWRKAWLLKFNMCPPAFILCVVKAVINIHILVKYTSLNALTATAFRNPLTWLTLGHCIARTKVLKNRFLNTNIFLGFFSSISSPPPKKVYLLNFRTNYPRARHLDCTVVGLTLLIATNVDDSVL